MQFTASSAPRTHTTTSFFVIFLQVFSDLNSNPPVVFKVIRMCWNGVIGVHEGSLCQQIFNGQIAPVIRIILALSVSAIKEKVSMKIRREMMGSRYKEAVSHFSMVL